MQVTKSLSVSILLLSTPCLFAADERKPVPSSESLAAAEKLIKDVFKDEYARTEVADKRALAKKLFEQAQDTNDDLAARFVLFREAIELAAQAGDLNQAFSAAEELAGEYAVGSASLKAPAVEKALARLPAGNEKELVVMLLPVINDAVTADDYDSASRMIKVADAASRKSKNLSLFSKVRERVEDFDKHKANYQKVQAALATLKTKPDDADAKMLVGRHLCFINGNWDEGLPLLAQGGSAALRMLAQKDLDSKDDAADHLSVADGWYDVAAGELVKSQLQLRAYRHYKIALPGLSGLSKAKAEKRLAELDGVAVSYGEWAWMHTEVRKRIAEGRYKKADIVGGAFSRDTFEEVPRDGSILIGFRYTIVANGAYPGFVQPIWRTARGKVYGKEYGVPEKGAKIEETIARPGYAVGAIYTRGGGGFDAFKPIYMKLTEKGMDTGDRYEGPHIGGNGGGERTLGGDGHLIIGLHGKVSGKEQKIEALSVVSLTAELKRRE